MKRVICSVEGLEEFVQTAGLYPCSRWLSNEQRIDMGIIMDHVLPTAPTQQVRCGFWVFPSKVDLSLSSQNINW